MRLSHKNGIIAAGTLALLLAAQVLAAPITVSPTGDANAPVPLGG